MRWIYKGEGSKRFWNLVGVIFRYPLREIGKRESLSCCSQDIWLQSLSFIGILLEEQRATGQLSTYSQNMFNIEKDPLYTSMSRSVPEISCTVQHMQAFNLLSHLKRWWRSHTHARTQWSISSAQWKSSRSEYNFRLRSSVAVVREGRAKYSFGWDWSKTFVRE